MLCKHCNNETNEKQSGVCSHCALPLGGGGYAPPAGFAYDPASGWYYTIRQYIEVTSSMPMVDLTWFDPETGEYHEAQHPDPTGGVAAASAAQPLLQAPPEPPRDFGAYAQKAAAPTAAQPTASGKPRTKTATRKPLVLLLAVVGIGILGAGVWLLLPKLLNQAPSPVAQTASASAGVSESTPATTAATDDADEAYFEQLRAEHAKQLPMPVDISLDVRAMESHRADIILSGVNLQREYPVQLEGIERQDIICSWGIEIGEKQFAIKLDNYRKEEASNGETVAPEQMYCGLYEFREGAWHQFAPVEFEIQDGDIVFMNVTLPQEAGIDLQTTKNYKVRTVYGLANREFSIESAAQAAPEREFTRKTREVLGIADTEFLLFAFVEPEATQITRLMLYENNTFRAYAQMGGSDYYETGTYRVEENILTLTREGDYQTPFTWEGELSFLLENAGELRLLGGNNFGFMKPSQTLNPIAPTGGTRQYEIEGMVFGFPYTDYYRLDQGDRIYEIYLLDDWSFSFGVLGLSSGIPLSGVGNMVWPQDTNDCELVFSSYNSTYFHENEPRMIANFLDNGETLRLRTLDELEEVGSFDIELKRSIPVIYD